MPEEELEEPEETQEEEPEKPKEEQEISNIHIVPDETAKETIVKIYHSMDEEATKKIGKLTTAVQSLTVGLLVLVLFMFVLVVIVFLNIPEIDAWVRETISYAVALVG